jgi:TfoX/Sxy family transcriptional regulator of competence genes
MASDLNFVEYVRDQINGAGQISFKKMFGEYAIYCDEKVVALVCDNQLFIKPTAVGRSIIGSVIEAPPYPSAKQHFKYPKNKEILVYYNPSNPQKSVLETGTSKVTFFSLVAGGILVFIGTPLPTIFFVFRKLPT